MAISDDLLQLIIEKAALIRAFDRSLAARGGVQKNSGTRQFVSFIGELVSTRWPDEVKIDQKAASTGKFTFNFYVPSEETAIELALGMRNTFSEYENDIFMALLAKEAGLPLQRLILIGKHGAIKVRNAPGSRSIRDWVKLRFNLTVEVHEFGLTGFGAK